MLEIQALVLLRNTRLVIFLRRRGLYDGYPLLFLIWFLPWWMTSKMPLTRKLEVLPNTILLLFRPVLEIF